MLSRFFRFKRLAVFTLLLPASYNAVAQRPAWTPIPELLVGSLSASDATRMSDVMSRCTALNILFAGLAEDFSKDMSQNYENTARQMIEHGVLIESKLEEERTGEKADVTVLSGVMVQRVSGMLEGYSAWLDENKAAEGFSINKDIELEMESCKLASRLMNKMAAE
jgi:hypothetical protein